MRLFVRNDYFWKQLETKQTTMSNFKPILLLLLFVPFLSFGQYSDDDLNKLINSGNEGKMVQTCSELMAEGFYFQSAKICDKLLELKPNSANYNYRRGFIYLEMSQDFGSAIPHLEKAVTDLDKNWDAFSPNEESAPLDALYFMAKAYHMGMDINKAENFYTRFINESKSSSEYVFFSKLFLQQCAVAR